MPDNLPADQQMRQPEPQASIWLRWAQVIWVVVVTGALLMYMAGSILYYQQLQQVCTAGAEQCGEFDYATPAGVAQLADRGLSLEAYALLVVTTRSIFSLIPAALGILIFFRKRSEPIALLVSFFLVTWAMTNGAVSVLAADYPVFSIPAEILSLISTVLLALFLGLFPNGRMVPRAYWAVVAYFGLYFLQGMLGLVDANSQFGSFWSWSGWLLVLFGGVAAQIYRYVRVSTPVERQKTRWVLFGMGVMALFIVSLLLYTAITGDGAIGTSTDPDLPRRFVFLVMGNLGFEIVFLSIGLAILRSQLFDIDVIIRKSLQYAVLTALLALVYLGSVVLLQGLFGTAISETPLLIVLSTLLIAALFNPLRRRVQGMIDRRFFRKKYDAQQVLALFAQTARDETDMDVLTAELVRVVQETMQPEHVGVWLGDKVQAQKRPLT